MTKSMMYEPTSDSMSSRDSSIPAGEASGQGSGLGTGEPGARAPFSAGLVPAPGASSYPAAGVGRAPALPGHAQGHRDQSAGRPPELPPSYSAMFAVKEEENEDDSARAPGAAAALGQGLGTGMSSRPGSYEYNDAGIGGLDSGTASAGTFDSYGSFGQGPSSRLRFRGAGRTDALEGRSPKERRPGHGGEGAFPSRVSWDDGRRGATSSRCVLGGGVSSPSLASLLGFALFRIFVLRRSHAVYAT